MSALSSGVILDGRYELLGYLDRGGMATVYRARDRRLDRLVAVKVLDAARRDEAGIAFREDRLTARLSHPHIVAVYDGGTTPTGQPFLVMELIDGRPVGALAPLPVGQALRIVEDVASAVAYTHERGIVHCDIKPQNVLLDSQGRARLADFGVASADRSPAGAIVYGSAPYLAPERLRGAAVGPAVDIYALGATLYYLLSGRPPHDRPIADDPIDSAQPATPRPLAALVPGIPPAVEAIVERAMAADPAARYGSAADLCAELAALRRASGEATSALRITPAGAIAPPSPPDPAATTELPDAVTVATSPPDEAVATAALPPAPGGDGAGGVDALPARAGRLEELNAAYAALPRETDRDQASLADVVSDLHRRVARLREVPGRARAAGGALRARVGEWSGRAAPWRAQAAERGEHLARALGQAARRWLVPIVAAALVVLVVVAGVRTLADQRAPAAGAVTTAEVPALLGLGPGEARDRLAARELALGRVDTAPFPGQPVHVVIYQDPPAGAQVATGTAINVVLRAAP